MKSSRLFFPGLIISVLPFGQLLVDSSLALLYRDLTNVCLPWKALWARALLELGRLPHWNPFIASGVPFLSDPAAGMLHPFNLLFLLSPDRPERGLVLFLAAHFPLLFAGGFFFARALRARPWIAFAGGISFAWSGFALSCVYLPHSLAGQAAVPFFYGCLLRSERASHPGALRRWLFGASIALAFPALVGDVQFSYLLVLSSAFRWVFLPERRANATRLARVFALSALLAAPQLGPALAHFSETTRAAGALAPAEQLFWSLHPARLVEFLYPLPFGPRPNYGSYIGYPYVHSSLRSDPFIFSFYPGLFCTGFGLLYLSTRLARRRRWRHRTAVGLSGLVLATLLALGAYSPLPVATVFARLIPLWGAFRYPERLVFWVYFLAWIAAVRGAERLIRLPGRSRNLRLLRVAAPYLAGGLALLAWSAGAGFFPATFASLLFFSMFVGLLAVAARNRMPAHRVLPVCALLTVLDGGVVAAQLLWPMPAGIARPGFSAPLEKIVSDRVRSGPQFSAGAAFRYYTLPQALVDETDPSEAAGRASYGSQERDTRKAWAHLRYYTGARFGLETANRQNTFSPSHPTYSFEKKSPALLNRFLDLASVRYLVMENERSVLVRRSALPYASFPARIEDSSREGPRLVDASWQPQESAFLEAMEGGPNPTCWVLTEVRRNWDRVDLQLSSRGGCGVSWLLVNEAFMPGWKARSKGGRSIELRRANGWALGVAVPAAAQAGEKLELNLEYREASFLPGVLLGFLGLAIGLFPGNIREKTSADLGFLNSA